MKILILSPLFPPDTAASARYVKELAAQLNKHTVSILLYGHRPEAVQNVKLLCIDKQKSVFLRALAYTKQFYRSLRDNDCVIIQNGPSVELPALIVLWFTKKPFLLMERDSAALDRTLKPIPQRLVHKLLVRKSLKTLSEDWPLERPTIHPLKSYPKNEMTAYENSWQKHIDKIESLIKSKHV